MLKSVIQQEHVDLMLRFDAPPCNVAVWPNSKDNSISKPPFQHLYFIAGTARASIATAENSHSLFLLLLRNIRPNRFHCAVGCATALVHQSPRGSAHPPIPLWISKQLDPRHSRILGTAHLQRRASRNEALGNLRKILHRFAEHRHLSERRWFQNIVSARFHQRPANEHPV